MANFIEINNKKYRLPLKKCRQRYNFKNKWSNNTKIVPWNISRKKMTKLTIISITFYARCICVLISQNIPHVIIIFCKMCSSFCFYIYKSNIKLSQILRKLLALYKKMPWLSDCFTERENQLLFTYTVIDMAWI